MRTAISRRLFMVAVLAAASQARADGMQLLQQWLLSIHSCSASFSQSVVDDKGRPSPEASGSFAFERPGRFRWVYRKPYSQDIVSDGRSIWTYDHDLNQVTVSRQSSLFSSTPAALLAGADVASLFQLKPLPDAGGLQWVEAVPRSNDSAFVWVRLGLRQQDDGPQLVEMQLRDGFRRTSTIRFDAIRRNPGLPAATFRFTPPPGAALLQQP